MSQPSQLRREIGIWGAMMMGLGSIVGTGVFVSLAIATGIAGPSVLVAIFLAAIVAICNGLSSAQLAANYPVSGGTYEYGYRLLPPWLGFIAGWMFMFAKSASASTAALGLSGYLLHEIGVTGYAATVSLALVVLLILTSLTLIGIKRTNRINIVVVSITLLALALFVVLGSPTALERGGKNLAGNFSFEQMSWPNLLEASALMFVAYTGYGRIATLGEEVKDPRRTIPRAVIVTLAVSMILYFSVALIAVAVVGADAFAASGQARIASLSVVADQFKEGPLTGGLPGRLIAIGAVTAMLGVLLNLILGLSRVLLAMARRRDMPNRLATVSPSSGVPMPATIVVACIIGLIAIVGDIRLTWSFSAFAVLIYYSITNACALRLTKEQRIFPIWTAWIGLAACLTLAFWVPRSVWIFGTSLIIAGVFWSLAAKYLRRSDSNGNSADG